MPRLNPAFRFCLALARLQVGTAIGLPKLIDLLGAGMVSYDAVLYVRCDAAASSLAKNNFVDRTWGILRPCAPSSRLTIAITCVWPDDILSTAFSYVLRSVKACGCKYTGCPRSPSSSPEAGQWNEPEPRNRTTGARPRLDYPSDIPDSPSCMSPNMARDDDSPSLSLSLAPRAARSCASRAACARIWSIHSSLRSAPPSRASGPASAFASSARLSSSSTCALIGLIDRA